jgi:hypothetical protein
VGTCASELDEDGQVDFKGKAKAFVRTYAFVSSILPFTNAGWQKLSISLNFPIPKLPAPREGDLSKGILEAIDLTSFAASTTCSATSPGREPRVLCHGARLRAPRGQRHRLPGGRSSTSIVMSSKDRHRPGAYSARMVQADGNQR